MAQNSCESCTYYTYDEDYESYMCDINMDEDEYMRLISDQHYQCPYYRNGDEYMVVRKQMCLGFKSGRHDDPDLHTK